MDLSGLIERTSFQPSGVFVVCEQSQFEYTRFYHHHCHHQRTEKVGKNEIIAPTNKTMPMGSLNFRGSSFHFFISSEIWMS